MIRQRKEDRLKTYEKQKRQALFTKIGFGVLAVLVVLGAGWWGYGQWQTAKVSEDVQQYFGVSDFAGLHESGDILYEQVPPVGGPHNAVWQNCGFYSQYLNNVNAVHSLEHGAVWITYDPDKITDDELQTLRCIGANWLAASEAVVRQALSDGDLQEIEYDGDQT